MPATATRTCPFHDCDRRILPDHFACYAHWKSLSPRDQARIYECYGQWKSGEISGETLRLKQQEVLGNRGTA